MNLDRFKGPEPMTADEIIEQIGELKMRRDDLHDELCDIDDQIEELRNELTYSIRRIRA